MSPDTPEWFGRRPVAAARAAVILALLGIGAIGSLVRMLTRPGTPLGEAFLATGIPPWLLLVAGSGMAVATAAVGFVKSVRTAERYAIAPDGFRVRGGLGEYTLAWDNILSAEVTPSTALGICVERREAVLATHSGTEQQREWLRTLPPFGAWDFLFPAVDLGRPAAEVLEAIRPHLRSEVRAPR